MACQEFVPGIGLLCVARSQGRSDGGEETEDDDEDD
jgi:hypothetical protein